MPKVRSSIWTNFTALFATCTVLSCTEPITENTRTKGSGVHSQSSVETEEIIVTVDQGGSVRLNQVQVTVPANATDRPDQRLRVRLTRVETSNGLEETDDAELVGTSTLVEIEAVDEPDAIIVLSQNLQYQQEIDASDPSKLFALIEPKTSSLGNYTIANQDMDIAQLGLTTISRIRVGFALRETKAIVSLMSNGSQAASSSSGGSGSATSTSTTSSTGTTTSGTNATGTSSSGTTTGTSGSTTSGSGSGFNGEITGSLSLDNTWGSNGVLTLTLPSAYYDEIHCDKISYLPTYSSNFPIVVACQGPIAGNTSQRRFLLLRLDNSGTYDSSFGGVEGLSLGTQNVADSFDTIGAIQRGGSYYLLGGTGPGGGISKLWNIHTSGSGILHEVLSGYDRYGRDFFMDEHGWAFVLLQNNDLNQTNIVRQQASDGEVDTNGEYGISGSTVPGQIIPIGASKLAYSQEHSTGTISISRLNRSPASLDNTFGTNGERQISVPDSSSASPKGLFEMQDGSLIFVGIGTNSLHGFNFAYIGKLTANGSIDQSFAAGGVKTSTHVDFNLNSSDLAVFDAENEMTYLCGYADTQKPKIVQFDSTGQVHTFTGQEGSRFTSCTIHEDRLFVIENIAPATVKVWAFKR